VEPVESRGVELEFGSGLMQIAASDFRRIAIYGNPRHDVVLENL
jgi:hypothetical protein